MVIDVKDLREGDEIIVPVLSKLAYVKVERAPQVRTKLKSWQDPNITYYKNVRCKLHVDVNCMLMKKHTPEPMVSVHIHGKRKKSYVMTNLT